MRKRATLTRRYKPTSANVLTVAFHPGFLQVLLRAQMRGLPYLLYIAPVAGSHRLGKIVLRDGDKRYDYCQFLGNKKQLTFLQG